ncbi:MAG: helicase C-terminal domain-containing protein [Candidatus Dormibacteria bacterium]
MPPTEYVALDIETTGLVPEEDRLIEVGAVIFDRDGVRDRYSSLVNPHRRLTGPIRTLTGLADADLRGAPEAPRVLRELGRFLGPRPVVGHGASFDIKFLARLGLPGLPDPDGCHDTLELARIILPEAVSHSLGGLTAALGLPAFKAHRALPDAEATSEVFRALAGIVAGMPAALRAEIAELLSGRGDPMEHFFVTAGPRFTPVAEVPGLDSYSAALLEHAGSAPGSPEAGTAQVQALLGPGGPAAAVEGHEYREGQLDLALAVAEVLRRGGRLVAEAGTGTGKSLACLVPALCSALARREPVVYATSTINLQEQLFRHDLPGLTRWFPWGFTAAMVKGRGNYLCRRRWERFLTEPVSPEEEAEVVRFRLKVMVWLSRTRTGDRGELRLGGYENWLWERVSARPPECLGSRCGQGCFLRSARARAEGADLVLANHDLLLADALTGGTALPAHRHLVVDEAHHLEDAATRGMTRSLEEQAVRQLVRPLLDGIGGELARLGGADPDEADRQSGELARDCLVSAADLFQQWQLLGEAERGGSNRSMDQVRLRPGVSTPRLEEAARNFRRAALALEVGVGALARNIDPGAVTERPEAAVLMRRAEGIVREMEEQRALVDEAAGQPEPGRVYWLTVPQRRGRLVLHSAPVTIGEQLAEAVYAGKDALVLTSATLSVAGSFDYFRAQVGLGDAELDELSVDSPFDFLRQALVCIPTDFAELADPDYPERLTGFLAELLRATDGKTLVLFTSHEQLRDTYHRLRASQDLDQVVILAQGVQGNRSQVTQQFVASPRAVLLGTSSFWEGVDLPGDSLQCVVIQKLPFQVPTEPVFAARSERVHDPFRALALPQAAIRLKQGFGRLIRTTSDRGAVVLLDQRIRGRDYGRALLSVLPRAGAWLGPTAEVPAVVGDWLNSRSTAGYHDLHDLADEPD